MSPTNSAPKSSRSPNEPTRSRSTSRFRQHAAGKKNLITLLPVRTVGGKTVFDLEVGKPTNEEMAQLETNEWYRNAPWDGWNPANVPADKKEKLTFSIAKDRPSTAPRGTPDVGVAERRASG